MTDPITAARNDKATELANTSQEITTTTGRIDAEKAKLAALRTQEAKLTSQVRHLNAALGEARAPRADTGTKRGNRAKPAKAEAETEAATNDASTVLP